MRAVVYDAPLGPVSVRDVPDPVAPAGGVVVDVHATGLCRSDWHAWAGHEVVPLPHTPGHELAGIVSEVGDGVTRWAVGDRVTVPFVEGCGDCEWCASGHAQVCPDQQQPGFTHPGSFAERVALHAADTNLVRIPEQVPMEAAAALGCRFATAYRGLVARAGVSAGEWVLIVGGGGVGLSSVMIAAALGARSIVVDPSAVARERALSLGAVHALDVAEGVADLVHDLTEGGAHVGVDAIGSEDALATSVLSLRRRGRHVQIGLLPGVLGHPRVPMERVLGWELDVLGSHGMAAVDYPEMLDLLVDRRLDPGRLVERVTSLAEAAELLPGLGTAAPAGLTIIDPRLP